MFGSKKGGWTETRVGPVRYWAHEDGRGRPTGLSVNADPDGGYTVQFQTEGVGTRLHLCAANEYGQLWPKEFRRLGSAKGWGVHALPASDGKAAGEYVWLDDGGLGRSVY